MEPEQKKGRATVAPQPGPDRLRQQDTSASARCPRAPAEARSRDRSGTDHLLLAVEHLAAACRRTRKGGGPVDAERLATAAAYALERGDVPASRAGMIARILQRLVEHFEATARAHIR